MSEENKNNKKQFFTVDENSPNFQKEIQSHFESKMSTFEKELKKLGTDENLINDNDIEDIIYTLEDDDEMLDCMHTVGDGNYDNIKDLKSDLKNYKYKSFINKKGITSEKEFEERMEQYDNINSNLEEKLKNFVDNFDDIYESINTREQIRKDGDYDNLIENLNN